MDHASSVHLRIGERDILSAKLIKRIAQTRGLDVVLEVNPFRHPSPALSTQQLEIHGLWPIVAFLCERYPEPELLPGDCVQRALIRSLTTDLLAAGRPTGAFARMRDRTTFIFGAKPSLIDLTYLVVTEGDPDWRDLHDRWSLWIMDQAIEACIEESEDDYEPLFEYAV